MFGDTVLKGLLKWGSPIVQQESLLTIEDYYDPDIPVEAFLTAFHICYQM